MAGFFPEPVANPSPPPAPVDHRVDPARLRAALSLDADVEPLAQSTPRSRRSRKRRRPTRCLVNVVAGPDGDEEHAITRANHAAYAKRCEAEYVVVRAPPPMAVGMGVECHWKYSAAIVAERYEQTLLLDNDCVVTRASPDLFRLAPVGAWGVVDELPTHITPAPMRGLIAERAAAIGLPAPTWQANGGVLLMPRDAGRVYGPDDRAPSHWINDQALLSIRLAAGLAPYRLLDGRANMVWIGDAFDPSRAWILHRAGFSLAHDRATKLRVLRSDVERFGL